MKTQEMYTTDPDRRPLATAETPVAGPNLTSVWAESIATPEGGQAADTWEENPSIREGLDKNSKRPSQHNPAEGYQKD